MPSVSSSAAFRAPQRSKTYDLLESLLEERILILDGAMGTMLQALKLTEADARGDRFVDHTKDLARFSDILCITRPTDITNIHRKYLAAGADIIETNTFGASFIGMDEFHLPRELIKEINFAAVKCARIACDEYNEKTPAQAALRRGLDWPHRQTDDHLHPRGRCQLSRLFV